MMKPTTRLRHLLDQPGILVAPGVYDSLTASIAAQQGFEALYMTGAGLSYSLLGQPDLGLLTMTEMSSRIRYIKSATPGLPIIADGDTGYGNAMNVIRTVQEYEDCGAAAIQLEDQTFPKRCGHLWDKDVISVEEAATKIAAAVEARRDPDFVIIARTDARGIMGMDEAIRRAKIYASAGADLIFVEAPKSIQEVAAVPASVGAPCMANMVEGGDTPLLQAEQLEQFGYKLVIFPNAVTRVVAKAAQDLYQTLRATGSTESMKSRMLLFPELNQLLGIEKIREMANRFKIQP